MNSKIVNNKKVGLSKLGYEIFDPSNIIFKNMKGRMMYPMYKSLGEINESDKQIVETDPIIIKTPFITLKEYPLHIHSKDLTKPVFNLYHRDDEPMCEEMNQIFSIFNKLDEYTKTNLSEIIKLDKRIKNNVTYLECIRKKNMKGKEYSCIKFKLNLNLGEKGYEDIPQRDSIQQYTDKKSLVPVIKLYYKSNFQNSLYRVHPLSEINRVLKPGKRARFIITINKLWFNDAFVGYGIKIMQMEVDDTLSDKFKMLKSLKSNETNMFNKFPNSKMNRDKYEEYLQRSIKFGSTREQKKKSNERIIKIINQSDTNDSYLFDRDDEYIPYELSISI